VSLAHGLPISPSTYNHQNDIGRLLAGAFLVR
jgi:hypothetical protein